MAGFKKLLAGALDKVGTGLRLPELGLSERLAGGRTTNTGLSQQSQKAGFIYNPYNVSNYQTAGPAYNPSKSMTGNIQGVMAPPVTPSTGGQPTGGGGTSSGGGGGTSGGSNGSVNLTPPQFTDQSQSNNNQLDLLRQQYGLSRQGIESQSGQLDQTYNLAKGDIQSAISDTEAAANAQKQEQQRLFGDVLRNQLQTNQDLNRQRMGTFSALGSLDSSEFQNQQFKGDQAYQQQRTQTEQEQAKTIKQIDDSVVNYRKQATSELSRLALQYQSGKDAIQQALAQNNLQEAGAIQSALDQISERATQVQNSIADFVNKAALLKAQGTDVKTNISGMSGNDYANYMNALMSAQANAGKSMYALPTSGVQGAGYIGSGTTDQKKKSLFSSLLGA